MSTHLKFMQGVIYKPIFVLKKDHDNVRAGRKTSVLVPSISDAYISDIVTESIVDLSNPSKNINIRRIFVTSFETQSSGYNQVGWALNDDISICMLCRSRFGMRNSKHHCKACGNVFCQTCSNSRVAVTSLEKVGPLRVCNLCYYGQVNYYYFCTRSWGKFFYSFIYNIIGNGRFLSKSSYCVEKGSD